MSGLRSIASGLYRGEVSLDIVGRAKLWYAISLVVVGIAIFGVFGKGFNLGIEFRGGAEFQVSVTGDSVAKGRQIVQEAGIENPIVTQLGTGTLRIQTLALTDDETNTIINALATGFGVAASEVQVRIVGPSWGADITRTALNALLVFLALVSIFLALTYELRMAAGALVALLHDVLITVGLYALIGFEVTPATAIGFLTILGYSLYDTVVVFDKVKENTKNIERQSRFTYTAAANLAVNQSLIRSVNTSIVAILPVAGILFVGAGILGAGTLRDISLALFIGMIVGTYSSLTLATVVLVNLKERTPEMQALRRRASNKTTLKSNTLQTDVLEEKVVVETGVRNQPRKKPRSKR
jgi:preprotein translocase subunit SecF